MKLNSTHFYYCHYYTLLPEKNFLERYYGQLFPNFLKTVSKNIARVAYYLGRPRLILSGPVY